jgi:ABC-type sulfate/molybdate transport systems ATPase subunit
MTTPEPLLRGAGLTVTRGGRAVVRGACLELHRGEIVALLGPNGAGKSSLLAALAGLLPAAAGTVERRGRVAIALQSADLARRSVLANVVLALAWWGVPGAQRRARALVALDALGAGHLAARRAAELSGGERRRVHLARAVAVAPDILLLDEPFAGLDAEARAALLEDALSVLRAGDRATLVVVHDRAEAWALADRLLIMLDGEILASGPPRELLRSPPTAAVARLLGYDGALSLDDGLLLTRPAHVALAPGGPLAACVTRAIPTEDGVRLELTLPAGRLYARAEHPSPRVGEEVRIRIDGGARFPVSASR